MSKSYVEIFGWRLASLLVFVLVAGTFPPASVWAQSSPAVRTVTSTDRALADSLDPFARYRQPVQCAMHAVRLERQFWRARRADTTQLVRWGVPFQRSTVASVRQCLARFPIATVPVRDLISLGRGYVSAEDYARADSAFQRLIVESKKESVEDRAWLLLQMVTAYAEAEPAQLTRADQYLAELDKLGADAASAQMMAHLTMAKLATDADSVAMLGVHAKAAVAAGVRMPGDTRKQRASEEFEGRIAVLDWYVRRAVFDSARAYVGEVKTAMAGLRPSLSYKLRAFGPAYDLLGTKGATIETTWVFNNPDSVSSFPVAGKPTLIVYASAVCGDECFPGYAPMRRLAKAYGASGLHIVLVSETYGFFGDHLYKPEDEAARAREYQLDHLKLPATLAIWNSQYKMRDDGWRVAVTPPGRESYYPLFTLTTRSPFAVLIDRNGMIRIASALNARTEARFRNILAEM